jgi:hypothetical protein
MMMYTFMTVKPIMTAILLLVFNSTASQYIYMKALAIVLSTLLFEEIELLEGLKSVDGKNEIIWGSLTESGHEILELDIIEDNSGDVMGVWLGHGFVWSGLDGGDKVRCISLDG